MTLVVIPPVRSVAPLRSAEGPGESFAFPVEARRAGAVLAEANAMGRFTQPNFPKQLRQHERRTFRMPAWIDLGAALPRIACTYEDVSLDGARIQLAVNDCLPARFELFLSQTAKIGITCEVRWRQGEIVGVKYVKRKRPS